jgi:hypothetical protein
VQCGSQTFVFASGDVVVQDLRVQWQENAANRALYRERKRTANASLWHHSTWQSRSSNGTDQGSNCAGPRLYLRGDKHPPRQAHIHGHADGSIQARGRIVRAGEFAQVGAGLRAEDQQPVVQILRAAGEQTRAGEMSGCMREVREFSRACAVCDDAKVKTLKADTRAMRRATKDVPMQQ